MLTKSYLLKVDNILREAAPKSNSFGSFQKHIADSCFNQCIKIPKSDLVRMRSFRILDWKLIQSIYSKATFALSINQINKWRNTSIKDILESQQYENPRTD